MNRKDGDDPNHLEGSCDLLNAEVLKRIKELLESLHFIEKDKMKETLVRRSQLTRIRDKRKSHPQHVEGDYSSLIQVDVLYPMTGTLLEVYHLSLLPETGLGEIVLQTT